MIITTGFDEFKELDSFFRGANVHKVRLFLEASHEYDVSELVQADGPEITAKCVPQTRVNVPARYVKIETS